MSNKSESFDEIDKPIFTPQIPSYLSDKLTPSEKYMVESISIIEQSARWSIDQIILIANRQIDLNDRVSNIEKWKEYFSGKWAIIGGIGVAILGATLEAIASHFIK